MKAKSFSPAPGAIIALLLIASLLAGCTVNSQAPDELARPAHSVAPTNTFPPDYTEGISILEDEKQPHPYRAAVSISGGPELNPGDTYSHTVTIHNTGDNPDTYTITAISTLGWDNLSSVPPTLVVAAHTDTSFVVTGTVPITAAPTTQDVLDASVKGQHGSFDGFPIRTTVHCPLSFSDVRLGQDRDSLDYAAYYVACRNIIAGFGSGAGARFAPQDYVTRAEFAQALAVGLKLIPYTPVQPSFSDVPASDPAYVYIETAVHAGAMQGDANNLFQPNGKVKRGEAVNSLVHTYGSQLYDSPVPDFRDVPRSRADYPAIEAMLADHNIEATPCSGNPAASCFHPDDDITRGELSRIIMYMLDR
jgi:hypothetical protein